MEPNLSKVIAIGEMRMDLDRKLKTALDESRLLILGAQVLFGFLFQAVFQDLFRDVSPASQALQCVGLGFMLLSVCFLIAPSLYHQILFDGESRPGALAYASWFAAASLLPLGWAWVHPFSSCSNIFSGGQPGQSSASPSRPAPSCSCTDWDLPSDVPPGESICPIMPARR
jgi:hypothetical protein